MIWPSTNNGRDSKPRKPNSSNLRASSARSFGVLAPLITAISRKLFCTADPTNPYPASRVKPVFSPSAPIPMASSGLRFCWRILFQVNSRSPNSG